MGVYKNEEGFTPVLQAVKQAEHYLVAHETSKNYLGIDGDQRYTDAVSKLLLGSDHPMLQGGIKTTQVPGNRGLRVAAELLKRELHANRIWVSDPTWANHHAIFRTVGLEVLPYTYYISKKQLDFKGMLDSLQNKQDQGIFFIAYLLS